MKKPVVVLADTDIKIVTPLELRFLEEYDDKIDLQIITDAEYFNEYFSSPKNVDVLVADEELYSSELQKQNIPKMFVLTEEVGPDKTNDLIAERIQKYSSIKEIFNRIVSLSSSIFNKGINPVKSTQVLLFYSAGGGAGKTTLALGVSYCLVQSLKKVLYINAERINSFQYLLNSVFPVSSSAYSLFTDQSSGMYAAIKPVLRNEHFDYLPPFGVSLSSLGIGFGVYKNIVESVKRTNEYDYIVVDTDSVFDDDKAELISISDKVFIICEQTKKSLCATNMLLKNISFSDKEKFIFLCNKYDENSKNHLVSSGEKANFAVNEYIKAIKDIDSKSLEQICAEPEMQKAAYMII